MSDRNAGAPRPESGRSSPSLDGMRAAMAEREWLWRKSGLILSAVIAVVIASMTLTPSAGSVTINNLDKLYHFVAFGVLVFPLILTDSRRWAWAVPLVILYGGAIELIQPTVGRMAEWLDFGANTAGALTGAALAELLHDRIRASVFDDLSAIDESDQQTEEQRMDAIRSEMMDELRVLLREELASIQRPGGDAPVGPSPAEEAAPRHAEGSARLRH